MAASTPRRVFRLVAPWGLALFLLVQLGGGAFGSPALAAGTAAPNVQATLADGGSFDLSRERGHVVVLNFWASWCGPCRHEAPVLSRAHQRLVARGGKVVGLSVDGQPDTPAGRAQMSRSAQAMGMVFPVALANAAATRDFHVGSLPSTFVINHAGQISASFVGAVSDAELESAIAAALR
ncbi:MAG: TlpA family protein disulfide reductase [Myxococcales bacterium]|nr:TlpA family protein disulfide reductase [Myxococcales bacterium]